MFLTKHICFIILYFTSRFSNREFPIQVQEFPNGRLGQSPRPLPQKWSQPGFDKIHCAQDSAQAFAQVDYTYLSAKR